MLIWIPVNLVSFGKLSMYENCLCVYMPSEHPICTYFLSRLHASVIFFARLLFSPWRSRSMNEWTSTSFFFFSIHKSNYY